MAVTYDDEIGWLRVDDLLSPVEAAAIVESCEREIASLGRDLRVGDKPHSGTRRLVDIVDRVSEAETIVERLRPIIEQIVGNHYELVEGTYRCPQPGFGQQLLHADDVPRLEPGPNLVATAIVALTAFTEENGATRLIPGSNHRIDLQRRSGSLEHHPDQIRLTGPAGCGFVFCGHTLHSGMINNSDEPRPCLQLSFRIKSQAGS